MPAEAARCSKKNTTDFEPHRSRPRFLWVFYDNRIEWFDFIIDVLRDVYKRQVIADEPTGNIDPELSLEMMELLERVSETGITVVVVTHEHELVRQFHQRVVTLKKGRIISDVPADKEAIRARAERKERLFETELEPADTAEKEAATV